MMSPIAVQLFWIITIGLFVGFAGYYIFKKRGINMLPSLLVALAGSVIVGLIAIAMNLPAPLAYSLVGSAAFLFVVNTYRQKKKPIFMDTDHSDMP